MNKAASKLINKYLGDWVENLNSDQLDVSLFSGKISLENLAVKKDVLQLLGVPFDLQHGSVKKINIRIPWGSLQSKPLIIEISEICLFVTPINPTTWSEPVVRETLIKKKFATLSQFEALQDNEIEKISAPGFFERWLQKIVENVELTIEKVYIRYEDNVTSMFNYSLGMVLERLTVFTCNENWEQMFISNADMCYKFISITSFSLFCDYNVEMVLFQEVYADNLYKAFSELANHEFNSQIVHNYILMPFTFDIQLTLNKSCSKDYPLINAKMISESMLINIYTQQIVALLQLTELMKLFTAFYKGVETLMEQRNFVEEEEAEYKINYQEWLSAQLTNDGKRSEKVAKNMVPIELSVKIEEIVEARKSVLSTINKEKKINEKIKEIDSLNKEYRGMFSRLKKVIANLNDAEYAERVEEESGIIALAELELHNLIRKTTKSFESKPDKSEDWLKALGIVLFKEITVTVFNNEALLTLISFANLNIVMGVKDSMFLDLQVASLQVQDCVKNDSFFPNFFTSCNFQAFIQESPPKLQVSSGDIYICCLMESLLTITGIFQEIFENQVDISSYKSEIAAKYSQYLHVGQDYVKMLISQNQGISLDIDINLKAPVIIFPIDYSENSFFLIDLGSVIWYSSVSSQSYQQYTINLTKFGVFAIWQSTEIATWKQGVKEDIFSETSITLSISQSPNTLSPTIEITSAVTEIWIEINPKVLKAFSIFESNLLKLIPDLIQFRSRSINIEEMMISDISVPKISEMIPLTVFVSLKSFGLIINEMDSQVCEVVLSEIKAYVEVESSTKANITIGVVSIFDERENAQLYKVLSNPCFNDCQVQISINVLVKDNVNDIGVAIADFRLALSPSFIEALLDMYVKYAKLFIMPKLNLNSRKGTHYIDTVSYSRTSINMKSFEVWICQKQDSTLLALTMAISMVMISNFSSRTIYSSFNLPIETKYFWTQDEIQISLSHLEGKVIKNDEELIEKPFILPCRVFYEVLTNSKENDVLPLMSSSVKIETFEAVLCINNIFFFQNLSQSWNFLPMPVFADAIFDMNLQCNSMKITVISDLIHVSNLFVFKLGKIVLDYFEDGVTKHGILQIEVNADYHNTKYSVWEPFIEKWGFALNFEFKPNEVLINFKSKQVLNVNITHYLVSTFQAALNTYQVPQSLSDMSTVELFTEIEYNIENQLNLPMEAWLIIGKNTEKWEIAPGAKLSFTEGIIKKMQANVSNRVKWTSVMSYVKTPVLLAFSFIPHLYTSKYQVAIDEISMKVIIVDCGKFQFPCMIHNYSQGNKRILTFQTGVFIANNISLINSFFPLPLDHFIEPKCINLDFGQIDINETRIYSFENSLLYIVEVQEYELDLESKLKVVEINHLYTLKNLLAHDLIIEFEGKTLQVISPGQCVPCQFDPLVKLIIKVNSVPELISFPVSLFCKKPKHFKIKFESVQKSSITVTCKKSQCENYQDFSMLGRKKTSKNPELYGWVLEVSSDFLLVNRTEQDLSLSGLHVPIGEHRYFSKKTGKIKAKLSATPSIWSKEFSINTIGVSGMVKIEHKELTTPQCYLYGVTVSQAPDHLIYTKIVTFVPRFLLYNFTSIPLQVRQHDFPSAKIVTLLEKTSGIIYYLDDYNISKAISLCSSDDWTGAFSIETLSDFQVSLQSQASESEKVLTIYERQWYIPFESNNFTRFIRVVVHTDDEATIHISFMDPKDPDFRIVNKSDEVLVFREVGFKKYREIQKFQSVEWAWKDHLAKKKKVKLRIGEETQKYSLEKVKDYKKKKISEYSVSVVINGITRELWIESETYKQAKNNRENSESSHFLMMKDGNQEAVVNPRFAIQGSLIPMQELVNSMDSKFLKVVAKETKTHAVIKISEMAVTIFDTHHSECFSINCKKLTTDISLTVYVLGTMQKVTTEMMVKLEHFQIDVIERNPEIFPVMLCPVRREKEVNDDQVTETDQGAQKYYFFMLELQHSVITKVKEDLTVESKHKFENLELALQEMRIHIHEETIYKLLSLKYIFDLLNTSFASRESIEKILKIGTEITPFNSEKIESKAYFRFLKLRAIKFTLTIKQSTKQIDTILFSNSMLSSIVRVLAGAFASMSETAFNFKEVYILDAFQSIATLTSVLGKQYTRQGIIQFYKVLGSIDLLGNPINLIDKLGTGVFEFFAAPAKGLVGGPKSFAKGLGKGVQSLVSGVVEGSFDSVSKISGTLYDVLKKATGDTMVKKNYTENIPKNMLIGLGEGVMDVVNGVTHLFIKPYKGARAQRTKGFFKGVLMGSIGFITSPVKLALKFGNVISVTITATTVLIFKGKLQKYGRSRYPRYFSQKKILQGYNSEIACVKVLLDSFPKYRKQIMIYYSQCILKQGSFFLEDKAVILLLTTSTLLYVLDGELQNKAKISSIQLLEIHLIENIYFLCIATSRKNFSIPSKNYSTFEVIYSLILSLNPNIQKSLNHKFESPEYFDLKELKKTRVIT